MPSAGKAREIFAAAKEGRRVSSIRQDSQARWEWPRPADASGHLFTTRERVGGCRSHPFLVVPQLLQDLSLCAVERTGVGRRPHFFRDDGEAAELRLWLRQVEDRQPCCRVDPDNDACRLKRPERRLVGMVLPRRLAGRISAEVAAHPADRQRMNGRCSARPRRPLHTQRPAAGGDSEARRREAKAGEDRRNGSLISIRVPLFRHGGRSPSRTTLNPVVPVAMKVVWVRGLKANSPV
jgi:hypothetical protein